MGKALRLLVAAGMLFTAAPAAAEPIYGATIVGGQIASRSYDYAAALKVTFPDIGVGRCAGALISSRHVVTAAHCLVSPRGAAPARIQVALGNVDYDRATYTDVPVGNRSVHPKYSGHAGDGYDVGLIGLPAAVPNEQLRLLRPTDDAMWAPGTPAIVIGWGVTEDRQPASSQLREVQVPIYDDRVCEADFQAAGAPDGFFKPETMLCAGGHDGRDACNGDSGGPLMVADGHELALVGLVSLGLSINGGGSCAEDRPGVYSRIAEDPLNSFVRSVVPQVEIELSPRAPKPGDHVVLTASGARWYDGFAWDLDADGAFDDATGTSVGWDFPHRSTSVAVRATRGAEAEVRRLSFTVADVSPVTFGHGDLTVREGHTAVVRVTKRGSGSGEISVLAEPGSADLGSDSPGPAARTLGFGPGSGVQDVALPTTDDRRVEGAETFSVRLTGPTGQLSTEAPSEVVVTILDDDVATVVRNATRRARVRRGRFRLRYATTAAGRVAITVKAPGGGRTYARRIRRHGAGGRFQTWMALNSAGREALRKRGRLSVRVDYAVLDGKRAMSPVRSYVELTR